MSDSEEIYASDESTGEKIEGTKSSLAASNSNVTIDESGSESGNAESQIKTDEDSDEEIVSERVDSAQVPPVGPHRSLLNKNSSAESDGDSDESDIVPRRRRPKRYILTDSEEESDNDASNGVNDENPSTPVQSDEEEFEERQVFSPRTRMSLTGIRPVDLYSSDSDDNDVLSGVTEEPLTDSGNNDSKKSVQEEVEIEAAVESTSSVPEPARKPRFSPSSRYSTFFKSEIENQLSSTICERPEQPSNHSSSSDDVQILTVHQSIQVLSSDDDNSVSLKSNPGVAAIDPTDFVQPTIRKAFSEMPPPRTVPPPRLKSTPLKPKFVSQEYYNKKGRELQSLKDELKSAETLLEKMIDKLPDGGQQLKLRCSRLRADLSAKSNTLSSYKIETAASTSQAAAANTVEKELDWDELSRGVNQMQPQYTGKRGIATFTNQKAMTVDRLKDMHGSLQNCPSEDVLAEDPAGLKVSLMDHQKHALAWMSWRETQKPRGGILADDMGLGKTLSMIALILAAKNRRESDGDNKENDSDDDDEANDGWSAKGRRDCYKGHTLVVCPASLIGQWENEVKSKVRSGRLTICVHHGNNRDSRAKNLRTYDIVVTTYHVLAREESTGGPLFGIKYERVILDEAHMVRNHKTKTSIAVCAVRATYRWLLTGTPIQNKEIDVYALLKFLRCTPFDDLPTFKKWIDNKSAGGQQRLTTVMKTILLRRTKAQLMERGKLECLPQKTVEVIQLDLDKDEMNVYQKIMTYSRSLFAQFLFARAERNSDLMYTVDANRPTQLQMQDPNGAYHKLHEKFSRMHHTSKEVKAYEILLLILRLRQICCHPGLIDAMLEDELSDHHDTDESGAQHDDIDLLEQLNNLAIEDPLDVSDNMPDRGIAKASAKVLLRSNPVFRYERASSKMLKVFEILKRRVLSTNDKAIIVSQWSSVLNIMKSHLARENIATLSITGAVPVKDRINVINQFNKPGTSERVMLLSLTAGGVGLNLVGANHLFLVDLHWNPQLEAQAQDRIYRVGQKKDVFIYKFMCKGTIEERIKALQDKKMELAEGVLTGVRSKAGSKLTIDEMKSLFGFEM